MNNFVWNRQEENDIYWAWDDWDVHYFACVLNNGMCIVYSGITDETCDGEYISHLEPVEFDYDQYGIDDIAMWIEIPRDFVINNKNKINKADEHPAAPNCNVLNCPSRNGELIRTDNSQVIANLQAEIERLKSQLQAQKDLNDLALQELERVEKPWRDAKKELPEHGVHILLSIGTSKVVGFYDANSDTWYAYGCGIVKSPDNWMPIPEQKGGK